MVLVTHELGFAHHVAARVLFLHDGVIHEQGTPAEVLLRPREQRTQEFIASGRTVPPAGGSMKGSPGFRRRSAQRDGAGLCERRRSCRATRRASPSSTPASCSATGSGRACACTRASSIFLEAHLDRLFEGARSIAPRHRPRRATSSSAVVGDHAPRSNGMTDGAHIRLMVTRGLKKTPNQDPRLVVGKATIVIVAEWKTPQAGESSTQGLALFTSTIRTRGPDMFDMRLNSHSRLNLIPALIQAIKAGADEALMLDPHGFVASLQRDQLLLREAAASS